ncbi:MAG: RNA methyltransferase [Patescibacteria group bacterium]
MRRENKNQIIVICHNIRSCHNVGSIFRTADGAGVSKIFLCGITPTPCLAGRQAPHPNIKKVSLGAEKYVKWEKHKDAWRVIEKIKKAGFKIISLEQARGAMRFDKFKPRGDIALIIGNEVKGLPQSILKKSDKIIYIPMLGKKESLNVAVAFGIAIYHLRGLRK